MSMDGANDIADVPALPSPPPPPATAPAPALAVLQGLTTESQAPEVEVAVFHNSAEIAQFITDNDRTGLLPFTTVLTTGSALGGDVVCALMIDCADSRVYCGCSPSDRKGDDCRERPRGGTPLLALTIESTGTVAATMFPRLRPEGPSPKRDASMCG